MMQLLSEMDGFDDRGEVRIMAATNRFDMLDEAILRPGRFDRLIEVPEPNAEGRARILEIHTQDMNVAEGTDVSEVAADLEGYSGADDVAAGDRGRDVRDPRRSHRGHASGLRAGARSCRTPRRPKQVINYQY